MWELIQSNRRKSFILFILLGFTLIMMGYLFGRYYLPNDRGMLGVGLAGFAWLVLSIGGYVSGDAIMLAVSGAKLVTHDIHPALFNVVEEMKIAANMPVMPNVYIIDSEALNAFAVGKSPDDCSIAVTAGLLAKLDRDELQGVIAHEVSHIINRDSLFITFAGVTLGCISLISAVFWRTMGITSGRYRSRSSGNSSGYWLIWILAIVFAIVGTFLAKIMYFAISRKREYLADASAVRLTRYPEGLASALEKIDSSIEPLPQSNIITAPLYIVEPFAGENPTRFSWFSTHPRTIDRIKVLRGICQSANYFSYEDAYSKVMGKSGLLLPKSALANKNTINLRQRTSGIEPILDKKIEKRKLGDLIMAINDYTFLKCVCGMMLKIPPKFACSKIECPKCGHSFGLPVQKA